LSVNQIKKYMPFFEAMQFSKELQDKSFKF